MFFRPRRLSTASLVELCRSLRYSLSGGMTLRDAMELLATKGIRPLRPVAAKIAVDLKAGWSLTDALQKQEAMFPPLFLALAAVGEESGNLPEVMGELESYYTLQRKLQRDFLSDISWPIAQLAGAVAVVALLILILGLIAESRRASDDVIVDPLGVGLVGGEGALIFLGIVAGAVVVIAGGYWLIKRLLRRRAWVERFLLRVPAVGPCLRALALTRFCIALRFTLETNLSVLRMLRLACLATANQAFVVTEPRIEAALRRGNSVATSVGGAGVFPEHFVNVLAVAEESGRLPEMARQQAELYDDEAKRRLAFLNRVASALVWLVVAGLIIWIIINIFVKVYLKGLEKASGAGGPL